MNWVLPGYVKDALKSASQTEVQAMASAVRNAPVEKLGVSSEVREQMVKEIENYLDTKREV